MAAKAPFLEAWEGSKPKVVGVDALPTYKRVGAWFPGPAEDTERHILRLRRLNRVLDTGSWRVYERREELHGVRLVLSIDTASITVLEGLRRPFSGVGQAFFPSWTQSRKGGNRMKEEEEAERVTVSTISFIQANLQNSTVASGILTRAVGGKGIDMKLIQEPWYREGCIRGLNIPGYTLYHMGGEERSRACILASYMNLWVLSEFSCRDLVAVLVKYNEEGAERRIVVCSYLPYDSEDPPPSRELEDLVRYCGKENLYLLV